MFLPFVVPAVTCLQFLPIHLVFSSHLHLASHRFKAGGDADKSEWICFLLSHHML
jgi:hypothetical protein